MTLNPATSLPLSLALIGFGEAGETFASAAGWRAGNDLNAGACDLKSERLALAQTLGLGTGDAATVLTGADLVLCLVTADSALPVPWPPRRCCPRARSGAMNSVAPTPSAPPPKRSRRRAALCRCGGAGPGQSRAPRGAAAAERRGCRGCRKRCARRFPQHPRGG
jgi:hypothetical protein